MDGGHLLPILAEWLSPRAKRALIKIYRPPEFSGFGPAVESKLRTLGGTRIVLVLIEPGLQQHFRVYLKATVFRFRTGSFDAAKAAGFFIHQSENFFWTEMQTVWNPKNADIMSTFNGKRP